MLQSIVNGFMLGLVASPSCPSNAEEIRLGTRQGFVAALSVGAGAVAGDAAILLLLVLGLQTVLVDVERFDPILWSAGALVLAYVAWGIFREAAVAPAVPRAADRVVPWRTRDVARAFWVGFAITAFNPFTLVWWLGLLGPALTGSGEVPATFAAAVLLGALAWFVALAVLLQVGRRWLTRRVRRWILIASGVGAGGYALYFAYRAVLTVTA